MPRCRAPVRDASKCLRILSAALAATLLSTASVSLGNIVIWAFAQSPSRDTRRLRIRRHGSADDLTSAGESVLGTVVVAGATGRTGCLVVQELLSGDRVGKVIALVRNSSKASEVLPTEGPRLQVVLWNSSDAASTQTACMDAEAAIWCAEGKEGVAALGEAFAARGLTANGCPRVVMCSSAAITRPTWSPVKQQRFEGAADIPIVRLNPGDILGNKRAAEEVLRRSGAAYAIVRPTGLNDKWPAGRPILSQGDLAVGRTSRADLASLLVALLGEAEAKGKTFEAMSVAGYPKPTDGYGRALSRLRSDSETRGPLAIFRRLAQRLRGGVTEADDATFGLMQQMLPGEAQDSAALAMGQTYEQLDKGETGRLGPRGQERVPERIVG